MQTDFNSSHPRFSAIADALKAKFVERTAKVGVIGLGYVGLPFLYEKAKVGFSVVGIDRSAERVALVNSGTSYIDDVPSDAFGEVCRTGNVSATTSFDIVPDLDALVICVPTPLNKNLAPDLQYVESVSVELARRARPGQLISLESTTYPGTTDDIIVPPLVEAGWRPGVDVFVAHSPERVDPGNARYTTKNTNKVVGAVDPVSLDVAMTFYSQTIQHVVAVSSARAAELVKVFENTFRAVNIALVNELTMLCDRMNLDVWEVLDAAFTKPFGIMPFYPGPGVGGHCIPLDPHYLEWKAREYNFQTHFIALAGEINRKMPEFVVMKVARRLNAQGRAICGAKILCLGVTYKSDLADSRESPAIEVMERLAAEGAILTYHDPFERNLVVHGKVLHSETLDARLVEDQDLVVILTAHSTVDYGWVVEHAREIVDTRNATKLIASAKVTKL